MKNIDCSIYEYFTQNMCERKCVLYYFGRKFSGAEVILRINAFAEYLTKLGVKKGDVVTVQLANMPEAIFSIYAINKIGAVSFVQHPFLPAEALNNNMKKVNSKLLICMRKIAPDIKCECITCTGGGFFDIFRKQILNIKNKVKLSAKDRDYPYKAKTKDLTTKNTVEVSPNDLAVLLPSGGTTDESKIIKVSNRALNFNANATCVLAKCELDFGVLVALPLFHGFGLSCTLHALVSNGCTGVILPFFQSKKVARYVCRGKVHGILGVPNMFNKLLNEPLFQRGIKNMKIAFCGGDSLPTILKDKYDKFAKQVGSDSRLYQGYGLAEEVAMCIANSKGEDKAGSIGKPVMCKVKILDEEGNEVSVGENGEIAIMSDSNMLGYFGHEPFNDRFVRTGDIGYIDEEGYVFFLGRKKRIIVIGGMNIYLIEIEDAAMEIPEMKECAAVGYFCDDKPKIALFAVGDFQSDKKAAEKKVISALKKSVIKYALPSKIIFLSELPRTRVGKIDTKNLENLLKNNA